MPKKVTTSLVPEDDGHMKFETHKHDVESTSDDTSPTGSFREGPHDLHDDKDRASRELSTAQDLLANTSLHTLQSQDYRHVLDLVDRLRACGLGSILQLPQIVVCGNQSAGKSSVLEAITEINFPRKENLCTRFATQIVMRRDPSNTISTSIVPDSVRSGAEKSKLQQFKKSISDFSELPSLIEEAERLMGLGPVDDPGSVPRAFSRDVLTIEIAGPTRPQLTLVDLPGLIQSPNKYQSQNDVVLIKNLVQDYIKESRTIMLAVVSAKDDYANQAITARCHDVDPKGNRTLGIITKPDFLHPDSDSEKTWLNLAQNKDIYFELGWHILKNRQHGQDAFSFEQRDKAEIEFFSTGSYRSLDRNNVGILPLRERLCKLLFKHLKKELPNLQKELTVKHKDAVNDLSKLGQPRATHFEQQRFLMSISDRYQANVNAAVDGHYERDFFGPVGTYTSVDAPENISRLRAVVQHLNLQFASQMRQHGHKMRFYATESTAGTDNRNDPPEPPLIEDYASAAEMQDTVERHEAVDWVKHILVRTRGRELPGNFNPMLMSQLFREQSANWEPLALRHMQRVSDVCTAFVRHAIDSITTEDISERLNGLRIEPAMADRWAQAKLELGNIMDDKNRHPITYDPTYPAAMQESRSKKTTARMDDLIDSAKMTIEQHDEDVEVVNIAVLRKQLKELIDPDMDKVAAEDALDSQLAYYKNEVTYFIAAVNKQVIERHLLHDLADRTLSPLIVNEMSPEEIAHIAAEAEEVTNERERLEVKKKTFEDGMKIFREALAFGR